MTVLRRYTCNLCGGADEARLIGIYWKGTSNGDHFVERPAREVEHHLCDTCLRDARDIWERKKYPEKLP